MGCHGHEAHTNQLSSWMWGEATQRQEQNNQFREAALETDQEVGGSGGWRKRREAAGTPGKLLCNL